MSDSSEIFSAIKQADKDRRAESRVDLAQALTDAGIKFETKNDGAHLIIKKGGFTTDFWPGTGRWKTRVPVYGFGADSFIGLLELLRKRV